MSLREEIQSLIKGDVSDSDAVLRANSTDASIFERRPALVVFPKDAEDVAALARFVHVRREAGENISLTARSAGTDMSGGPLTDSIVVSFTKYMNKIEEVNENAAVTEPGVFYRDFEKQTLEKAGKILPPYPASREICALGGMIANNSGGELTLMYGKVDRYVRELDVVLSDGSKASFRPLNKSELETKKKKRTLEGKIYRGIEKMLQNHDADITAAEPNVSKNSAGYALWNIIDKERGTFDLTQLVTGSQGTLCLVTRARLGLVKPKSHHAMVVIFLTNLLLLPEVVRRVRNFKPESFESYDDHTFKLAVRYGYEFLKQVGLVQAITLGFSFLPEVWMSLTGGVPKLVLLAEFSSDSEADAELSAARARAALDGLPVQSKLALGTAEKKYWKIRRESFSLLRKHVHGLSAAAFIDDIIVHPDDYPKFIPELSELLGRYNIMYTIAGHIGDANLHVISLMDLRKPEHHKIILELTPQVHALVAKYKGSITAEHNDGIIRTPYLSAMFSPDVLKLFKETKKLFDPLNVFNPGKKVGGTVADIEKYMKRTVVPPAA